MCLQQEGIPKLVMGKTCLEGTEVKLKKALAIMELIKKVGDRHAPCAGQAIGPCLCTVQGSISASGANAETCDGKAHCRTQTRAPTGFVAQ